MQLIFQQGKQSGADAKQYIQNIDDPHQGLRPILLLGLLANYNKFELRNPYRSRFEDFVNNAAIQKIILAIGSVCSRSRDLYVAIQEDIEEGWTLSNTLKYIGLGVLAPSRSSTPTRIAPGIDDSKELFSTLLVLLPLCFRIWLKEKQARNRCLHPPPHLRFHKC